MQCFLPSKDPYFQNVEDEVEAEAVEEEGLCFWCLVKLCLDCGECHNSVCDARRMRCDLDWQTVGGEGSD